MTITGRINERRNPDTTISPLFERRGGTERRVPTWLQRARDGALYGYDENGKPVAGKDTSGSVRVAA